MSPTARSATMAGLVVLALHTVLALCLFAEVHNSREMAQAGLSWFWFMALDFPTTYFAWEYIAPSAPMSAIVEWGNGWGDGKNLRALLLHGVLGGAQWFVIAWIAAYLLWPRTGLIAKQLAKRNLTNGW